MFYKTKAQIIAEKIIVSTIGLLFVALLAIVTVSTFC